MQFFEFGFGKRGGGGRREKNRARDPCFAASVQWFLVEALVWPVASRKGGKKKKRKSEKEKFGDCVNLKNRPPSEGGRKRPRTRKP